MLGQPEGSERGGVYTLLNLVFGTKKQELPNETPAPGDNTQAVATNLNASIEESMAKLSSAHQEKGGGVPSRAAPKDDHSVEYDELNEAALCKPGDYAEGRKKFRRIWDQVAKKKNGAVRECELFPDMSIDTKSALVEMIEPSLHPTLTEGNVKHFKTHDFWRLGLRDLYAIFGDEGCTNGVLRKLQDMRPHCESAEEAIGLLKDAQRQRLESASDRAKGLEWVPRDVEKAIEIAKQRSHQPENPTSERAVRPARSDEISPPPPRRPRQDSYGRSERERDFVADTYRPSDRARDLFDYPYVSYDNYRPRGLEPLPSTENWRPSAHGRGLDDSYRPPETDVFHSPGRRVSYPPRRRQGSSPSSGGDESQPKGASLLRRPSPPRKATREWWQIPYGGAIPLERPTHSKAASIEWRQMPDEVLTGSRNPLSKSAMQEEVTLPKRSSPEQRRSFTRDALPRPPQANGPGNGIGRKFYRNMSWTKPTSPSTTRDQPNAEAANPPSWHEASGNDVPDPNQSTVPPTQLSSARIDINGVKDVPTGPAQRRPLPPVAASVKVWPHIFIPSHSVPAKRATIQHLENYLRKYSFKEVCVDRSGYYVTFDRTSFSRKSLQACGKECKGKKLFGQYVLEMRQFPDGQRTAAESLDSPRSPVETASSPPSKLPLMAPNRDEFSILGRQRAAPEFLDSPSSPVETASSPPSKLPLMAAGKDEFSILGRAAKANANVSSGPAISAGDQGPHVASDTAISTPYHKAGRSDPRLPHPSFGRTLSRQDREDAASSISERTVSDISSASLKQCHICKKAKKTDILVRCTTCPRQYHNYCHSSALPRAGSGWQCQRCIRKNVRPSNQGSQGPNPAEQPSEVVVISSDHVEPHAAYKISQKPRVSSQDAIPQTAPQQTKNGTSMEKIWRALAQAGNTTLAGAGGRGDKQISDDEKVDDLEKQGASSPVYRRAEKLEEQEASTQGRAIASLRNEREVRIVVAQPASTGPARHAPELQPRQQAAASFPLTKGRDVTDGDQESDAAASSAVASTNQRPSCSGVTPAHHDAVSVDKRTAASTSTQAKSTATAKTSSATELSRDLPIQETPSLTPTIRNPVTEQTTSVIETAADTQRRLNTVAPETTVPTQEPSEKADLLGSALTKDTLAIEADDLVERSFSASGPVGTPQSTAGDKKASKLKFVRKKIVPAAASPPDAQPADGTIVDSTGNYPSVQRSPQNDSAEMQNRHEVIEEIQQSEARPSLTSNNDLEAARPIPFGEDKDGPLITPGASLLPTGNNDFERHSRDTSESAANRPAKARRKQKTTVNCEICGKPTARRPGRPARCRQCTAADDARANKLHAITEPDEAPAQMPDAAIPAELRVSPKPDQAPVQNSAEHMWPDGVPQPPTSHQSQQEEQGNEEDTAQESTVEAQNDAQGEPVASDQDSELEPSNQLLAMMDGSHRGEIETDSPQSEQHEPADQDENEMQSRQSEHRGHLVPAAEEPIEAQVQEDKQKASRRTKRKKVEHGRSPSPPLKKRQIKRVSQRCDAKDEFDLGNWDKRPKATYARLIAMALLDTPTKRLQVDDAVNWIFRNVPGYETKHPQWVGGIKSTLDLNSAGRSGEKICTRVKWRAGNGGSPNKDWYALIPGVADKLDRWDHLAKRPIVPGGSVYLSRSTQQMKKRGTKHASFDVMDIDDGDAGENEDANNAGAASSDEGPLASRPRSAAPGPASVKALSTSQQADNAAVESSDEEHLSVSRSRSGSNTHTPTTIKTSSFLQQAAETSDEEPLSAFRRPSAALAPTSVQPAPTLQLAQTESDMNFEMTSEHRSDHNDAKSQDTTVASTQPNETFKPLPLTGSEDDDLLNLIRQEAAMHSETTKSLAEAWPEYHLSEPQVSAAQIAARPTRKQNFGKSPCYSRLGNIDPLYSRPFERDEPEVRPGSLDGDVLAGEKLCSSVNELFGLQDLGDPVPIAHNGELAFTQPKSRSRSEKYCTGIKLRGKGDVVFKGKKMEVGVEY